MKLVQETEFYSYLKDKEFVTKPGNIFHSTSFIINKEEIGIMETSSWNNSVLYYLKYSTNNTETIDTVSNIIKNYE